MSRAETERALRDVRKQASAELDMLEDERHQLERLIAVINEYLGTDAHHVNRAEMRTHRRTKLTAIDTVREQPGVRTSMLAMVLDRPWESVADELKELERQGRVRREGRRWFPMGAA